jgi:hypothetical protein
MHPAARWITPESMMALSNDAQIFLFFIVLPPFVIAV